MHDPGDTSWLGPGWRSRWGRPGPGAVADAQRWEPGPQARGPGPGRVAAWAAARRPRCAHRRVTAHERASGCAPGPVPRGGKGALRAVQGGHRGCRALLALGSGLLRTRGTRPVPPCTPPGTCASALAGRDFGAQRLMRSFPRRVWAGLGSFAPKPPGTDQEGTGGEPPPPRGCGDFPDSAEGPPSAARVTGNFPGRHPCFAQREQRLQQGTFYPECHPVLCCDPVFNRVEGARETSGCLRLPAWADTRVLRSCDRGARHPIRHMLPALLRRRAGPRDGVGVWGAGTGPRQGPQGPGWDWNEKPGPGARNAHNSEVNSRSHQLSNSVWRVRGCVNTTGRGA